MVVGRGGTLVALGEIWGARLGGIVVWFVWLCLGREREEGWIADLGGREEEVEEEDNVADFWTKCQD